jgi:hypothetical protein
MKVSIATTISREEDQTDHSVDDKGEKYGDLMPLLNAMYREFQDVAKKKPEAPLSKVQVVNRLLKAVFSVVEGERSRSFPDLLEEDGLPQNSDVVLILGQAVAAMETFKEKYDRFDSVATGWAWNVPD